MPESLDGALFWTDAELEELNGTCYIQLATGLREESMTEWEYLQSVSSVASWLEKIGASDTSYIFAKGLVISRQLEFEQVKVVAPKLDLLNHSASPNCAVEVDASTDKPCFVVRCTAAVQKSEELCISYGPVPNSSLLISYGFILDDNPLDCVEAVLSFPLPAERRPILRNLHATGERLMESNGGICPFELLVDADQSSEANGVFVTRHHLTRSNPLPSTFLATVRLQLLPTAELDGANILLGPGALAVANEGRCIEQAQQCLQQLLAGHKTTIEADEAILSSSTSQTRAVMAARVRLSEKQILTAALYNLTVAALS